MHILLNIHEPPSFSGGLAFATDLVSTVCSEMGGEEARFLGLSGGGGKWGGGLLDEDFKEARINSQRGLKEFSHITDSHRGIVY